MNPFQTRPLSSRAWIVFPAVLLTALDGALTLYGQPVAYWIGEFSAAHEYSPLGAAFLRLHPFGFAGLMVVWAAVVFLGGLAFRDPWRQVWALMIVIGHSTGSFDWLENFSYFGALTFFFLAAVLTIFSWRRADSVALRRLRHESPPAPSPADPGQLSAA